MSDPALLVERDGHVLHLTLNRPAKRNAFNAEMLVRLCDAWDLLDSDPELRVAVVTGADGNFSAGADLDRLVGALTSGKPAEDEFEERIRQDFTLIYKGFLKDHYVKKPLIAAVEGYCYAGGMEILQAFDIRVAAEDAQLAVSEVQRGLFPMSASTIRLPRQIPYTVAMDMLIVGDPITGQRAYDVGLVGHVTPHGGALARGSRAGRPAGGQRSARRAQHQGLGGGEPRAQGGRRLPARARAGDGGHGLQGREGGTPCVPREACPQLHRAVKGTSSGRPAGRLQHMSAKKRTGGRVTPKGTQPPSSTRKSQDPPKGWTPPDHGGDDRATFGHGRGSTGPVAPTRSGHHRGNR